METAVKACFDDLMARRGDLAEIADALVQAYEVTAAAFTTGGILYLCGNGGSFADAVHIKGELAKSFECKRPIQNAAVREHLAATADGAELVDGLEAGLPCVVLGESDSLRSAYENDRDPVYIYAQELNSFAAHINPGVLLALSTSGNACNCIAAARVAQAYDFPVIALTGPDGGALAEMADVPLRVPGGCTAEIQEKQLPVYHTYCRMLEAHFFGG